MTSAKSTVTEVVLDDLCDLRAGDQVPADGILRSVDGLELDESMLTGESDPMTKGEGAEVLSGSIAVAGRGRFQATAIGADAYARRLATEARRFTLDPLRADGRDRSDPAVRAVGAVPDRGSARVQSVPRAGDEHTPRSRAVVAGVVAMVPEGLVLLTSLAFGVAAVTLARRQVLVQELPAVEGLARVDVDLARQDRHADRGRDPVPTRCTRSRPTIPSPTRSARWPTTTTATRR